jgi:membrane associated rhomboid family serine protease
LQVCLDRLRFRLVILPIGLEDSRVNRIPVVSIAIVALTLLAFVPTWLLRTDPGDSPAFAYWEQHPHAEPTPETMARLKLPKEAIGELAVMRMNAPRPSDAELARQSETLDAMLRRLLDKSDDDVLRRFSVVPARGLFQIGWLSAMFLHFGWGHLLGNLLFFYVVAAFLEDVWGRPLFAAFYLLGGIISSLCQAGLDMHSQAMQLGASGAIAACMGAFSLRFPTRKVGFVYWFYLKGGMFKLPAWIWGAAWFAMQLFQFALFGKEASVAFMAHLAGFGFGVVFALAMKASKLEEKVIAPKIDVPAWQVDPRVEKARIALVENQRADARRLFLEVLKEKPDESEAALALAKLDAEDGNVAEATRRASRMLQKFAAAQDADSLRWVMQEVGASIDVTRLPTTLAYRLGELYEENDWRLAVRLYDGATRGQGIAAAKANLRAAELLTEHHEEGSAAMAYAKAALALSSGQPTLVERAQKALERARVFGEAPASLELAVSGSVPAEVIEGRLAAARPDRAIADSNGAKREVLFAKVVAIAAGQVGDQLIVDLVTSWEPQQIYRLHVAASHAEAFRRFCASVIEASGASCIPSRDAVLAPAQYPDIGTFASACYAKVA